MPVEYTQKHGGCAIVCGSAPSLHEDLAKAKELRPGAVVLGANFSARLVPEIDHVWTLHNEGVHLLKEKIGRKIYVHTRPREYRNGGGIWFCPAPERSWSQVDYYWPSLHWLNGSSGASAGLWAKHGMGFDEVILAGVQLSTDSQYYVKGYLNPDKEEQDYFSNEHSIMHYQDCMISFKEQGKYDGIYGMSGFPKGLLGAPLGLET